MTALVYGSGWAHARGPLIIFGFLALFALWSFRRELRSRFARGCPTRLLPPTQQAPRVGRPLGHVGHVTREPFPVPGNGRGFHDWSAE